MESKFWPELMSGLEQLFDSKENHDVVIQAKDGQIYAHSIILCCQSNYFRSNLKKKKSKNFQKKFNIPSKIIANIIRFIYCGKIDLNFENVSDIFTLLNTANEFELHSLVLHIQEFLIDNKQKEFIKNNVLEFFDNTFQNENFELVRNYCLEIIGETPELLFENNTFLTLSFQMIEFILKQEKITLDEIEIWNYLIKWAYAQNPDIDQDPSDWTNDEIEVMRQTTHKLIPLIRFQDISSVIYHDKVFPYEELLPKKLKNEIMQFYLVPNTKIASSLPSRKSKYSVIVTESQIFAIFASWIERKNNFHYNKENIPYKFNLIYRASRDGNTGAAFHNLCDNKGPTIVIAKVVNSEQIIGGYNPLDWKPILNKDNNYYKTTNDSFIFSFADRNNLQTGIVSYPKENHQYFSVYGHSSYGPIFGGGHDLLCKNNGTWTCSSQHTYSMDLPRNFNTKNYEVFQVTIKH